MKYLPFDFRFGLRQLRKSPGFNSVVILSLALGIAGAAVMFGLLNGLLLQPPGGVRAPSEMARLYLVRTRGVIQTPDGGPGSYLDFRSLQDEEEGGERIAAFFATRGYDYGLGSEATRVEGRPVSGEFFPVLGVAPELGRLLDLDDDRPGAPRAVVVLSDGFWRRELGADPRVVGRELLLDGTPYTVVGVASARFTGIDPGPVDLWTPLGTASAGLQDRADVALLQFLARIPAGTPRGQFRLREETRLAAAAADRPELDPSPKLLLGPLNAARGPHPSGAVRLIIGLLAATGLYLLIACSNAASLLLARAVSRNREFAVRRALGAGEWRIVRQLLNESVLLGLLGGGAGLALAAACGRAAEHLVELPAGLSWFNLRLVAFIALVSVATGLLFGLAPVFQSARKASPAAALGEAQPGRSRTSQLLSAALVAGQVALAMVLLASAGLCLASLRRAVMIDPGIALDHLVVASLDLRSAGYPPAEATEFFRRGLARLRGLPEVDEASLAMPLPLSGAGWGVTVGTGPAGDSVRVPSGPYSYIVGDHYFKTTGIPILKGRPLTAEDRAGSEPVAVVSEPLARALAPGGAAVGMCVPVGQTQKESGRCTRIVGVAGNVRHRYLVEALTYYVYRPVEQVSYSQRPSIFRPTFVVRTALRPGAAVTPLRAALQSLAPSLPYLDVQPMETYVAARAVRPYQIASRLLSVFGLLALALAGVGIYGTLAHFVANRTREVGVRVALGAGRGEVVRLVVQRALLPVALGMAGGLALSVLAAQAIHAQLQGGEHDGPIAVVTVVIALLLVALLASWIPARRAAHLDPVETLREE